MPIIIPDELFDLGTAFGVMPGGPAEGIPAPVSFASDSWATIEKAVKDGVAADVYSVGDEKTITLSDDKEATIRIANLEGDYYEYADGNGWTGAVFEILQSNKVVKWTSVGANNGGYPIADTLIAALDTGEDSLFSALPEELQAVISSVKVVGCSGYTGPSTLVSIDARVFPPACKEITNSPPSALSAENAALKTFALYTGAAEAAALVRYNMDGTAVNWWTRSPSTSGSSTSYIVQPNSIITTRNLGTLTTAAGIFCI